MFQESHAPEFLQGSEDISGIYTRKFPLIRVKTTLRYQSSWKTVFARGAQTTFGVDVWASCRIGAQKCINRWESNDPRLFGL
ncbi:hypothetical protein [Deinococcus misasensis]|uniref:hypothetical protein n=1 Tax=Deinococcus misasensis TaxID=392413 RepID=UPI0005563F16|nr:hypothetical protein [Deinococcus misasensis]